jgi:hypothetical protein
MKIFGGDNITSEGEYGDMDQAKKMDRRAKGEVVLGVRDWRPTDFYPKSSSHPLKQEIEAGWREFSLPFFTPI